MKYLLIILSILVQQTLAQTNINELEKTVNNVTAANRMQNKMIAELQDILAIQNWRIDSMSNVAEVNTANIDIISDTLHLKVLDVHSNAHEKIDAIDDMVEKNKLYWIVGSILFVILLGVVFMLLKGQINAAINDAETKRSNIEYVLREKTKQLEKDLLAANNSLEVTNKKLSETSIELATTNKTLADTQKELHETSKTLEATNEELDATNLRLEALQDMDDSKNS